MTPEEELIQFLVDNGDREEKAKTSVETWFSITGLNVRLAETEGALHGISKKSTFEMFTGGMVDALEEEVKCSREELLQEIRETLAEYLKASEDNPLPAEEVEHLVSVFPNVSRLPNNEFQRQLLGGAINDGEKPIVFDKKRDIVSRIEITQPATMQGLKVNGKYDYFDAEIDRGIDDIYMQNGGPCFFSLQTLYRVINHDPDAKASDNEEELMRERIENHRITKAAGNIEDVLQEARRRGIDVCELPEDMDDMILDLRGGRKEAGGKVIDVYFIKERPLPALFGKLTGQELNIPSKCYCIRKIDSKGNLTNVTLSKNPARIAIRGYLMERIFAMKNDLSLAKKKQSDYKRYLKKHPKAPDHNLSYFRALKSNVILYESVFEAAGIDTENTVRSTINRHKKYILQCLDYLCAINEIAGYTTKCGKRKNSVDRVEIILE